MKVHLTKVLLIAVVLAALLIPTAGTYAAPQQQPGKMNFATPHATDRILVKFKAGVKRVERLQAHAEYGGAVAKDIFPLGVQIVKVPADKMADVLARYRANPRVAYAEPDYVASGGFTPNDTYYASRQYGPQKIQADQAWDITTGDPSVVVAVLDSGADFSHPDLQGKLVAGWDYVNNDGDPADDHGHGTHVAGIIGAATDNNEGVAGVGFNTRLLVVKVLDQNNNGYYGDIVSGIVYAADQGAKVINLSLGGTAWSLTLWEAVEYAWNKGCLLVAAAGNENSNTPFYPAAFDHVMGVSATDSNDERWSLSNYGDYISVAAPGMGVYSTDWLGGAGPYAARSGTSQAAPHVSGVAALLLANDSSLTNAQLWSTIESTADDLGDAGWDPYFGYGRVNAYRALGGSSVPTPTPTPTDEPTPTPTPPPPTATPTPPPPTPTPTASTMHVGDMDGTSWKLNKKKWKASVTIAVHDADHDPVVNATISGSWSGGYSSSASCTTDGSGQCSVTTGVISTKKSGVTFTVNSVSHGTFTYQPSDNHDPDGDSNGSQITVYKP